MAYVRKTETLIDDVVRRIRNMAAKARGVYADKDIEVDTIEFGAAIDAMQTAAYREAPHLRGNLPESWLFKTERIHFKVLSRATGERLVSTYLTTPEHRKFELPAHMNVRWGTEVEVYDDECSDALAAWVQSHHSGKAQRKTIDDQYCEVERQVIGFLRTHASLNAAIKEMPEIELYVPDQYLRKMHEATAPRVKKEEQQSAITELGIDRNALAAVAIAHRITASN